MKYSKRVLALSGGNSAHRQLEEKFKLLRITKLDQSIPLRTPVQRQPLARKATMANRQPKGMSSRLATMKFMQRSGASPSSAPSTPAEPPSKKQRLSSGSYNSTPTSNRGATTTPGSVGTEEQRRAEAFGGEAADGDESKWYLSFKEPRASTYQSPLQIVSAGYSTLDANGAAKERHSEDDEVPTRPQMAGRRSFGKFNKTLEKQQNPNMSSDSDSEESEAADDAEDDNDEDDPTGANALIAQARKEAGDKARAERKAKRKAEKAETLKLAESRRNKHVKLNALNSISGSSGSGGVKVCHKCKGKGHIQRDCPGLDSNGRRVAKSLE